MNALLDRVPNSPLGVPAEPALPSLDFAAKDLETKALESRPEVHAARHHVDHMKAELWAARSEYLPDASLQYCRRVFDNDRKDDNIVMVKFNVHFL